MSTSPAFTAESKSVINPSGTDSDKPFTILTGPYGRFYLTENDELFSNCDMSLLNPCSETASATASASAEVNQIEKRVIRARSDDLPEVWYVQNRDDQTYKMGFNVSAQTNRANGNAIHSCRVHGQSSVNQIYKLRSDREEWINDMMNYGNLSTDPNEKNMIPHIYKSVPETEIKDDIKAEKDMISMMKSKLGLMWDYAIMPEITSRNYYLLENSQDRTIRRDGAIINKSNDKYETTFIEDPNGNLEITTHFEFDFNSNPTDTGDMQIKTQATKDDISLSRTRDEWINKVYNRGNVDTDTDRSISVDNQIKSIIDNTDDSRLRDYLIKRSKSALGHFHDLKYYQPRQ